MVLELEIGEFWGFGMSSGYVSFPEPYNKTITNHKLKKTIIKSKIFSKKEPVLIGPLILLLNIGYNGFIPCLVMASKNK